MNAIKSLARDNEYWELKERWKKERKDPFPPFNFDQYLDTEDYKNKLKMALESMKDEISLGEKVYRSQFTKEKVKCPNCSEGYYKPLNDKQENNYDFYCDKCGERIIFEKNIVVE